MAGLNSSLSTALTGLQAAETEIAVAGNNVANSGTDGFKQSTVLFANQFLQTQSIGSAPTGSSGGTNPRQIGLGVKVAAINPDFSQGTIQISSNPLDVAIQGDGFLIVQTPGGRQFTRNGQLQTNSLNQLVTSTGGLVLGQAADANFNIDSNSDLVPLSIPLGSQSVTQATKTAILSGTLSPEADQATAGVIESEAMGDFTADFPNKSATTFTNSDVQIATAPNTAAANTSGSITSGGGSLAAGDYEYKVVWYTTKVPAGALDESAPSATITVTGAANNDQIVLDNLPVDNSASPLWTGRRIYRSTDGGTTFQQIGGNLDLTTPSFTDTGALAVGGTNLDTTALADVAYSYYVTFSNGQYESRPSSLIGPNLITDSSSRVFLDNLPQPSGSSTDNYSNINIYRNTGIGQSSFERVAQVPVGTTTYVDESSDAFVQAQQEIDLVGKKASSTTKLTDVVIRDGADYVRPFVAGSLSFTGSRGARTLDAKDLTVDANTTVDNLRTFMVQAFGIDTTDTNTAGGAAGGTLTNGQLIFTSNDGIENALGVDLTSFSLTPAASSTPTPIPLSFTSTEAFGTGSTTDLTVFDKLGEPVRVRLTTALVDSSGISKTYRWFATSEDNMPSGAGNVNTFVGSGLLTFDANGIIESQLQSQPTISIDHPAAAPLQVTLDFSQVNGLATRNALNENVSEINLTQQDGFPPGTLTSFTITESGLIRGVFSNGAERALGQIRMARFANNTGLQQNGNNTFSEGINSGAAVIGNPGDNGIGTLTSGAVELSNSDIGQNLIDLILASTQYRGGARVITTAQQLFDELLNLRR